MEIADIGVPCCALKWPRDVMSGLSPRRSLVGSREEDIVVLQAPSELLLANEPAR